MRLSYEMMPFFALLTHGRTILDYLMTDTSDAISEFFRKLTNIEDRDHAAQEFKIWLVTKGVRTDIASNLATAFHQSTISNNLDEACRFIEEDERLEKLFIKWWKTYSRM